MSKRWKGSTALARKGRVYLSVVKDIHPEPCHMCTPSRPCGYYRTVDTEVEVCPTCGNEHGALYIVTRRLYDVQLAWLAVMLNGEMTTVEGSVPNNVKKLPVGAKRLSPSVAAYYWHKDSEAEKGAQLAAAVQAVNEGR